MKKSLLAAAAAISLSSSLANAAIIEDINEGEAISEAGVYSFYGAAAGDGAVIDDTWTFTLASDANALITIADYDIDFSVFQIGSDVTLDFAGTQIPENGVLNAGLLSAGTYSFLVSGSVTGLAAVYEGGLTVAPVPLPAGVWLLVTALGGLGFFARRRQQMAKYA